MTDKKCTCIDTAQTLNEEILSLHSQLAHEKLRADTGWERYESANSDRNDLRDKMAIVKKEAARWNYVLKVSCDENCEEAIIISRIGSEMDSDTEVNSETITRQVDLAIEEFSKGNNNG